MTLSEWKIPLSDIEYDHEEEAAALAVLHHKWLTMGPEVEAFEREFCRLVGSKHAVAVSSGTAALHLAFLAAGIGSGDEIIQPAINFVAAANMTVAVGARPVFADIIGLAEPTIDVQAVERLVTPHTKAIVVMHYGGYLCRMAEIRQMCSRRQLCLIEDACHGVGATYQHPESDLHARCAGSLGDIGCFSFFSNKNLAVGEGGMVTTNSDQWARQMRRLRSHGMTTLTWDRHQGHASSYDVLVNGYNYRLDEIRAALGRVQLRKLDRNNQRRRQLVALYRRNLAELPDWAVPFDHHSRGSAYHLMVAVAPTEAGRRRASEALRLARIQTSMHYPCIPDFGAFGHFTGSGLEQSRMFARRAITLPLYPAMSDAQAEEICSIIRNSQNRS